MSKKSMMVIILFLALVAAIYAPQKTIKIYTYERLTSPYNTKWGGTSDLVDYLKKYYSSNAPTTNLDVEVVIIDNISVLEGYPHRSYFTENLHDVLVIIGPDYPYSEGEIKIIYNFIMNGGSILIADELGIVNSLTNNLFLVSISPEKITHYISLINEGVDVRWRAFLFPINKSMEVDLPGYINQTGYLQASGYYKEYIMGEESGEYIIACCSELRNGRVYIIADTSPFINKYVSRRVNLEFILSTINWLSDISEFRGGGGLVRIYIDASHHRPASLNMPLPHIGRIIASYIEYYGSELNTYFQRYVINAPLIIKVIVMGFVLIGIYNAAKKWYRGKAVKDDVMERLVEREILLYSPEYEQMKVKIKRRGYYREVIAKLYELINLVMLKRLGITIEDLVIRNKGWDILSLYFDEENLNKLKVLLKDLYRIKEYLEGKRLISPVIFWRRKANWYISELTPLLKKLGLELGGE